MQTSLNLQPTDASAFPADDNGASVAGRMLMAVFEVLDQAGVRYCVLHGYEDFPRQIGSDVDCIVERRVSGAHSMHCCRTTPI
jgi:hypothetical protein